MFRKPSTLIAGAIKLGYYIDPDTDMSGDNDRSQFMCHAIKHVRVKEAKPNIELVGQTVELIENKLIPLLTTGHFSSITLHQVLKVIDKMDPDDEPSFKRKLKFWKEFIKELKAKGL